MSRLTESGTLTKSPMLASEVQLHHLAEHLTELLIYFMLVFSPWAFGTTEPWSIWTMNVCGYGLGVLLMIKMMIRSMKNYQPGRWGEEEVEKAESGNAGTRNARVTIKLESVALHDIRKARFSSGVLTHALAILTLAVLTYCLISAVNARATFNRASVTFEYHDRMLWLPHSFDSHGTWDAFWRYLALACSFWAVRDWLLGKSIAEQRRDQFGATPPGVKQFAPLVPGRLRCLLWVSIISGALLALEGIAQRLSGSSKLLFLVKPEIHQSAQTQFASYAYRANGAQYFNLLWPVCLGFWWLVHRSQRTHPISRHLILVCSVIMAACPIVSSARGAALVDAGMLLAAALLLLIPLFLCDDDRCRHSKAGSTVWVVLFFASVLALGLGLGWNQLRPRMNDFATGIRDREQLYERARLIAGDYPVFGTGPGTFEPVFQLYRISPEAYWPAQLHNDWLETRITFGWIGGSLIALALSGILLRWFSTCGIHAGSQFVFLTWLSLAGCLFQARWDFPLQVYSILFQFVIWCAVLFTLSRHP
jgi:O-antigen ligase/polysaccharide polymerase Wzy-like membrane protein